MARGGRGETGRGRWVIVGAWAVALLIVAGTLGALRWSVVHTPVRTGGQVAAAQVSPPEEVAEVAEAPAPVRAAPRPPPPDGYWTYRKSKNRVVTVERYEDIPEEYRETARKLQ